MKMKLHHPASRALAFGTAGALALLIIHNLPAADFPHAGTGMRVALAPRSAPEKSDYKPMSCPRCRDVAKLVPDTEAKGGQNLKAGGRATTLVVQHLCEGCATDVRIVGSGRDARTVVNHTCSNCGTADPSCCSTSTKHSAVTPGMKSNG